jgi:hypothetical protein
MYSHRDLGVGHVGIIVGTTLHSSFGENHIWSEVGDSWVLWWDLWVCFGDSNPQDNLI